MTNANSDLRDKVIAALDQIVDPNSGKGLVESGVAQGVTAREDGAVGFILETPDGAAQEAETLRRNAEAAAGAIAGVTRVTAVLTSHAATPSATTVHRGGPGAAPAPAPSRPSPAPRERARIPGVACVIAVASAKGGVGKSTVAANLAATCARLGLRVGLLDVDVYGPSIPTMMGAVDEKPAKAPNGKISPVEAHGIKTMSIGYLADADAPMVWRGPVATSAMMQMFNDVDWGDLDVLFVDTPPGTGDAALTLVQRAPLDGVVIVSTPQEVALADVRRGVALFRKTHARIIGLVENMAWFEDPASGARSYIFGEGGARRTAEALDIPFLGEAPLMVAVREGGDAGAPAVTTDPAAAAAFQPIAERVIAAMDAPQDKPDPAIIFE